MLEYLFRQDDLRFAAYAYPPSANARWPHDPRASGIKHQEAYRALVAHTVGKAKTCDLYTQLHAATTGEDKFLHAYLTQNVRGLRRIYVVREVQEDFTQVADFLTGCIYGDGRTSDKVKTALIRILRSKLGVASMWDASLASRNDFRVSVVA